MDTFKKILILAANPASTDKLRLDEEVREIEEGLRLSKNRDLFHIEQRWAVRIRDLRRALLDCEPHIVHFSGHGGANGIILEDEHGKPVFVDPEALAGLFELFSERVECVLLNACHSETQAEAIHRHVKHVIGMTKAIGDQAAIEFAVGFYDGLGAGRPIEKAFKLGSNALQLKNSAEHLTPVLKINSRSNGQEASAIPSEPKVTKSRDATTAFRIFLSYKQNGAPDDGVAEKVYEALKAAGHTVFSDKKDIQLGEDWHRKIEEELSQSDYFIPFLSQNSINSEMVRAEIERAHQLGKRANRKPQILPVCLQYKEAFPYPLNAYLNPLNWVSWEKEDDTATLIESLAEAIAGGALPITQDMHREIGSISAPPEMPAPTHSAQPLRLEMPEGTIRTESNFYIQRASDEFALNAIAEQGVTITIKAPRQMGKSSLLMRIMQEARDHQKKVVFLDFQLFDKPALEESDIFFRQFCSWLTDELELEDKVDEYWNQALSNSQRTTRYMQRYLLKKVNGPLVLAMDEVETVFDTEFRSDFFGMLRSWHNKRVDGSKWRNIDLALVTSTEPYQLIENLNQSPFNVGEVIDLEDFSAAEVAELNQRHQAPLDLSLIHI